MWGQYLCLECVSLMPPSSGILLEKKKKKVTLSDSGEILQRVWGCRKDSYHPANKRLTFQRTPSRRLGFSMTDTFLFLTRWTLPPRSFRGLWTESWGTHSTLRCAQGCCWLSDETPWWNSSGARTPSAHAQNDTARQKGKALLTHSTNYRSWDTIKRTSHRELLT